MIALTVMTGAVTKKEELTLFTKEKLRSQMWIANWLHFNRFPYCYVFPQGAQAGEGQRPCDLMSTYVLKRDPYCTQVYVPHGENLLTRQERVDYVEQLRSEKMLKVFGFGMIFRPSHYRGLEDDPMKDFFNGDMPIFPFENQDKVLPFRRRKN